MMFHRIVVSCCITTASLLCPFVSLAKILHIPTDAGSVKEAVKLAASGDEIVIDSSEVTWVPDSSGGIQIKEKDLTISGAFPDGIVHVTGGTVYFPTSISSDSSLACALRMERSHVLLRNLSITDLKHSWYATNSMRYTASAPIYLSSGSLTIQNCVIHEPLELNGSVRVENSTIGGSRFVEGYPYYSYLPGGSSVLIHSASNALIEMDNATIGSLELRGLLQSEIHIRNSRITGGMRISYTRWYDRNSSRGENGISMTECRDILLDLTGSEVTGGQGWGEVYLKDDVFTAAEGGDGIRMEGSDISLTGGRIVGGQGGIGFEFSSLSYPWGIARPGKGGNGLVLLRSHFMHGDGELIGGPGGPAVSLRQGTPSAITFPPGPDGEPLVMDEFSTFEKITGVGDWPWF